LTDALSGRHLVVYNLDYDLGFLPALVAGAPRKMSCAMIRFAEHFGDWDEFHGNYRWKSLDFAARFIGYQWVGKAHRAMADALACRAVWHFLDHVRDWEVG
jgi:DNA polymerase III epsilon subunit-like protein